MYYVIHNRLTGKVHACQCRRYRIWGFDPWVGKITWKRKWQPYTDRVAWWAKVHVVAKSQTCLSD